MTYLGIDIGSVSVKIARVAEDGSLLSHDYRRHFGRPLETALQMLTATLETYGPVQEVGFTGSGGKLPAELLKAPFENEVMAQSRATTHLSPAVKTLIEVGGEDSRLILFDENRTGAGVRISDFAMNSLCAAGCGAFLDQQAIRLGVNIEGEFGELALASTKPARVAGRCSVFAKTDMIHLQQKATPMSDIIAGLCFAFTRNFVSVLARGKAIAAPVAFHGGVAMNAGMVRAFRELLGLTPEEFVVPEYAACAGAIGAALLARQAGARKTPLDITPLSAELQHSQYTGNAHPPLPDPGPPPGSHLAEVAPGPPIPAYLGVDVGSISTNVVLLDDEKRVLAKRYLMTAGRPIEAVRRGLEEVGAEWADRVIIRGVCTTGSGRYLTSDFLGADLVKNEITAQARAAAEIDPLVDTIFEIGGQDSKYIALEQGAIVDFEMNKVCAAGTGSFLEEQAERLGISIKGEFAALALSAEHPVQLGERCTVFMESDLVEHQSRGAATAELTAGLAYSVVENYLNRVVQGHKIGERIFFQGGTAFNRAVVAAFRQVTGKPVVVPEHHEVTGAIGCALMAREQAHEHLDTPSTFKGWDISSRQYVQDSFECKACANRCEINRVRFAGEEPLYYGGRCEKYEKRKESDNPPRDLFAEREALLTASYQPAEAQSGKPYIGIPRALHFAEYLPFWLAFFKSLDLPVRLSTPTNKSTIESGAKATMAEFCFPVKVAHGHVEELLTSGITHLFVPSVVQLPRMDPDYRESVVCPYVQSLPFVLRAALLPDGHPVSMLAPLVDLSANTPSEVKNLHKQLTGLGISRKAVATALTAAYAAQQEFSNRIAAIGREVLAALRPDQRAVVIISRPYNGYDNALNLGLPRHFRELGTLPIPMEMLPLDTVSLAEEHPDLSWRYGQKILSAAELIRRDKRLAAVYLTNFSCGPDSFLLQFFRLKMGGKVFLQIEVDEHSSDVGALTRCEAFLDSLQKQTRNTGEARRFRRVIYNKEAKRTIYIPNICDTAYAVSAAFRSVGLPSEVLPEADNVSMELAKKYISGKECFPCLVTTGDMLRKLGEPGIKPEETAFFMPSSAGGCRFGSYNVLQRQVLDNQGYHDIPIFAPNQDNNFYSSLSAGAGKHLMKRAWQGFVACDLLQKAQHYVRPRELVSGATDAVYQKHLKLVVASIEQGRDVTPLMSAAREDFSAIPTSEMNGRPWIGVFGEIYIRMHRFSNMDLIRRLEANGAQVWLQPFAEWVLYVNMLQKLDARANRNWGEIVNNVLIDANMKRVERRLVAPWHGFIPNLHEPTIEEIVALGERYVDSSFRGESVICMGQAQRCHADGLAGIVNVMPFTCMPGNVITSVLKRFQQEHDNMPVLNLSFDGQGVGNLPIRLEAFVEQCKGYAEKK